MNPLKKLSKEEAYEHVLNFLKSDVVVGFNRRSKHLIICADDSVKPADLEDCAYVLDRALKSPRKLEKV
jgi:hypothetical protein